MNCSGTCNSKRKEKLIYWNANLNEKNLIYYKKNKERRNECAHFRSPSALYSGSSHRRRGESNSNLAKRILLQVRINLSQIKIPSSQQKFNEAKKYSIVQLRIYQFHTQLTINRSSVRLKKDTGVLLNRLIANFIFRKKQREYQMQAVLLKSLLSLIS